MLAVVCGEPRAAIRIARPLSALVRMQQLAAHGDRRGVLRMLDSLDATRGVMRPTALSFDIIVREACLADSAGEPARAARMLDVPLTTLPALSIYIVTEPAMAAAVGRGMAYRAELAARLGDPSTAAMWAGRVLTVWSHADANLEPTLKRMRLLVNRQPFQ
jgi:hypothetical protein